MPEDCCSNCDAILHGPYCSACGQRQPRPDEYSTVGFLVDAATEIFSVDGKTLRTARQLLLHPGRLTLDYYQGRRVRYLKPIQLFLIVNVIFFLIAVGGGIFDFTLGEYLAWGPPSKDLVRRLVEQKIAQAGLTLKEYAVEFNRKEEFLRKGLIFLLVPFLAAIVWALNFRQRSYFAQHLVFSIHFFSFFWLFGTITVFPVALVAAFVARVRPDDVLTPFFQGISLIYFYLMLRTVYTQGRLVTLAKAVICVAAVSLLLLAYRILLFFGTYLIT